MKKIKITEEQKQYAIKEGLTLTADVDAAGGDVKKAVDNTKKQAQDSGVDPKKTTIQIPPEANEGKFISKKAMTENRLKRLKRNSDFYSLKEFVNRLGNRNLNEEFINDKPTDAENNEEEIGAVLSQFGNIRNGFSACTTKQIINAMRKGGWYPDSMNHDENDDIILGFTKGEHTGMIYYDPFKKTIINFQSN